MSMRDLVFNYDKSNGEKEQKVYLHIFDFTDEIENNEETAPSLSAKNVNAVFFENNLTSKHFDTVKDLYEHCKRIMQ